MAGRCRVLWLARTMPLPLDAGDRIYTARLAEALARAGADLRVLALDAPDCPGGERTLLDRAVTWETVPGGRLPIWRALFSRQPVVGARAATPAFRARLDALLRGDAPPHAVVLDQHGLAWALPAIASLPAMRRPAIVHVAHDFETEVTEGIAAAYRGDPLRRLALRVNAARTARTERDLARGSDLIVTLTERDRDLFRGIGATAPFLVLPPGYDGVRVADRRLTAEMPRRVGLLGSYLWTAKQMNLEAFLAAAGERLAAAGIELAIAGAVADGFRRTWEPRLPSARFLGFVDDLGAFLQSCRMGLVIEAIGGGFKLKVLDYVFTRTPVAALAPALGGQAAAVTAHFTVREDAGALADAIIAAVDDPDRLNAMQEGAYAAAAPLYDWDENGRRLLDAIEGVRRPAM